MIITIFDMNYHRFLALTILVLLCCSSEAKPKLWPLPRNLTLNATALPL